MRHMRASPENRQKVYNAVRAYWLDARLGISTDTLAQRVGLELEIVEACCAAMLESSALEKLQGNVDYPTWKPAVVR